LASTRKVWNQHPYYVVNILDNLQLPTTQVAQDLIFGNGACPNGVQGPQMPLNLFMDQVPHLSASGCPEFPAPDITFYVMILPSQESIPTVTEN